MDIGGGGGGGGGRAEAERWLEIAVKLLGARDIVGSKKFAERALDSDPLLDGVDQILAVADVLLASQRLVKNHHDWYSILQLDPSADPSALKRQYRRLALLLHPDRNKAPGADSAFRLVVDSWAVLSDPSKKSLFDSELEISAAACPNGPSSTSPSQPPAASDPAAFWTACPFCCHVHQYVRVYVSRTIRCPNCRQAFLAAEIASLPPVVPGTDMYYCSWGFFPLGFPGAAAANPSAGVPESGWKPFYPMYPCRGNQPAQPTYPTQGVGQPPVGGGRTENVAEPLGTGAARPKKKMARKKVTSSVKKSVSVGEANIKNGVGGEPAATGSQPGVVVPPPEGNIESMNPVDMNKNMTEDVKPMDMGEKEVRPSEDVEMIEVLIDLDANDEVLGNLNNLPFLKDEEIQNQTP